MRINDGSICSDCEHFEHECNWGSDYGCNEYCHHPDSDVKEIFVDDYDYEKIVTECRGFKKL